ncbi:MAG: endonuclease MutS2 [Erysipelotrichaceae bacterium]
MRLEQQTALELPIVKAEIAHYCAFSLGKAIILNLEPSFDLLYVKRELKRSKEALELVIRYGNVPLAGVKDIFECVEAAMKDATLNAHDLRTIANQGRVFEQVATYRKQSEIKAENIFELMDSFTNTLQLSNEIESCISINFEVVDQASSELSMLRRSIRKLQADINLQIQKFIAHNSSLLTDNLTVMRSDRVCVLVKISEKNRIKGFIHGESSSGQSAYVEPEALLLLNNQMQSLISREKEEIQRILFMLSQKVKEQGDAILANMETVALIDAIFAKAMWGKNENGCIARIDEEGNHLYLEKARHPLIDPKDVVANTYEIKPPYHSLLITGSNTGGKSVSLKTIGLFVCMSMCGIPLPCNDAIIPFYDDIFVDVGDEQSIVESLSTFSSHLSKLAYITNHVSNHSLVLLDELGSGTDPKEGEALAIALLEYLRKQQCMLVATTHFSQLKAYGTRCDDVLLASVEFDVEQMRPTYRFIEGLSGQSNAFAIAKRFHLKQEIIDQAEYYKKSNESIQDGLIEKLEEQIMFNQQRKDDMELEIIKIQEEKEALEKLRNKLIKKQIKLEEDAKIQIETAIEDAKSEVYEIIDELKEKGEHALPHEITKLTTQLNKIGEVEEEEVVSDETFSIGDYVQLIKLGYYGEIISLQKDKVCVLSNGLKMNLKVSQITHAIAPKKKQQKSSYSKSLMKSFPMECNVIGMYVDEALPIVDKYLDNAVLAHANNVRIIHGVGTGALCKGVQNFLKRHPKVESYHFGGQGEGGLGATVVVLKGKGKS